MGEIVRPVGGRIRDVICCRPTRWVQTQNVAGSLRNVEAESVRRIRLRLGNRLAAGPDLARIACRRNVAADFTVAVDHCRPHSRALEQTTDYTRSGCCSDRCGPELALAWQVLTVRSV